MIYNVEILMNLFSLSVTLEHNMKSIVLIISKDMKGGHPLYPMEPTVSYPAPAMIFPQWSPMQSASILSQQAPTQQQQAPPPQTLVSVPPQHPHHHPHHPMYAQAPQLRPPLGVFNPTISSYMQISHGPGPGPEGAATFLLPMQQLQQLQIANGHPNTFCLVNQPHPHAHHHGATLFMPAHQQTAPPAQPQPQSQAQQSGAAPPPSQHDPSLVVSQVGDLAEYRP
jgi:hypothetical protein